MLNPAAIHLSLPLPGGLPSDAPQAGQPFRAVVQGDPGSAFLRLGASRVALPPDGPPPGTPVVVTLTGTPRGPVLQVAPQPAAPTPNTADALGTVLRQLNALPLAREAEALLPATLPRHDDTLGPLMRLLFTRGTVAADLARLGEMLATARSSGALAPALDQAFLTAAAPWAAFDAAGLAGLLRRLVRDLRGEARLAEAIQSGAALDEGTPVLREVLARLAGSAGLRDYLRRNGQAAEFDAALGRVVDRLTGAQHQQLHGHGAPYAFLEVPFPDDAGVQRAQVHFLEEGRRDPATGEPAARLVAFDLETERLGALWVALRATPDQTSCHLRAVSTKVVSALREATEELAGALGAAGCANARVTVSRWDGNRLREAAALLRRVTGLDLSG